MFVVTVIATTAAIAAIVRCFVSINRRRDGGRVE
jgi:hypothetical protein